MIVREKRDSVYAQARESRLNFFARLAHRVYAYIYVRGEVGYIYIYIYKDARIGKPL